jgi:hypothetical protein
MRHYHGTQTNFAVVADLNTFRILIFEVDIVTYEHMPSDAHASPTMQSYPKTSTAGTQARG